MVEIITILGIATITVSLIGVCFAFFKYVKFNKEEDVLAKRLSWVFLSDTLIYLITVLFGLFTFLELEGDLLLYPIRILFIILNIWASIRLLSRVPKKEKS